MFWWMDEEVVFVVLPQRMGPDVREGRRRQFSYIGNYFGGIVFCEGYMGFTVTPYMRISSSSCCSSPVFHSKRFNLND